MTRLVRRLRTGEVGQALVETALCLSLLLLILGGVIEFGRIFSAYLTANNSAREGARVGALGKTDLEIRAAVTAAAASLNGAVTTTITPIQSQRLPGVSVTVRVTYPVALFFPLVAAAIPNPYPVNASVVMRVES